VYFGLLERARRIPQSVRMEFSDNIIHSKGVNANKNAKNE
jgi:hypothetical protein